jgi:hypothetical protein
MVTLMDWLAESVRLTAFTLNAEINHSVAWWESAVGTAPAERLIKSVPPLLRETGSVSGSASNLVLEYQSGRVDWLLVPNIDPQEPPSGFPNIGQLDQSLQLLHALIVKWLPAAPPIHRLAVGVVALCPVEDRRLGYVALQPLLPAITIDPEGSSDFFYSINRPRISQTPGTSLTVNRLGKWGVVRMGFMQLAPGQPIPANLVDGEGFTACRVELDINSAPGSGEPIQQQRLQELADEFFSFSVELITKGDLP